MGLTQSIQKKYLFKKLKFPIEKIHLTYPTGEVKLITNNTKKIKINSQIKTLKYIQKKVMFSENIENNNTLIIHANSNFNFKFSNKQTSLYLNIILYLLNYVEDKFPKSCFLKLYVSTRSNLNRSDKIFETEIKISYNDLNSILNKLYDLYPKYCSKTKYYDMKTNIRIPFSMKLSVKLIDNNIPGLFIESGFGSIRFVKNFIDQHNKLENLSEQEPPSYESTISSEQEPLSYKTVSY